MSVIIILLGASLLVALFFLAAFIWSVKSGQFEDNFSPAHRILFDNKSPEQVRGTTTAPPSKDQPRNSRNTK